jgi:hypothetical protein
MIRRTRFERKTSGQVDALVQTLKRMIADESDSDANDPKECKALDTIFNHTITLGRGCFGEE